MSDTCSCPPDDCHGGHTITRLSATRAWMLAHDWTEMSEGDSGWMWQHTTGRDVAVFRDLTDRHAWEGLIGRLAVAHARHPGDIEREIRGGEEPVRLADEQLRRITEYVHPDEGTAYVRPWLHSMAGELLAARARVTELEGKVEHWTERTALAGQGLGRHVAEQEARIAELEAAQREPIGYAVTSVHMIDGSRHVHTGPILAREDADARARAYADARVVELREVGTPTA